VLRSGLFCCRPRAADEAGAIYHPVRALIFKIIAPGGSASIQLIDHSMPSGTWLIRVGAEHPETAGPLPTPCSRP